MRITIVSDSLKAIEGDDGELDDKAADFRARCLALECQARGGDWRVVATSEPFAFPTPEEIAAREKEAEKGRALAELSAIDAKAIRPLRAIAAGTAKKADTEALAALDARAVELRAALA